MLDNVALIVSLLIGLYILHAMNCAWHLTRELILPGIHLMHAPTSRSSIVEVDIEARATTASEHATSTSTRSNSQETLETQLTNSEMDLMDIEGIDLSDTIALRQLDQESEGSPEDAIHSLSDLGTPLVEDTLGDEDAMLPFAAERDQTLNLKDLEISSLEAVSAWLNIGPKSVRTRMLREECSPRQLRTLGCLAMILLVLTLLLAPLLPWFLTGFGLEEPLVPTQRPSVCQMVMETPHWTSFNQDREAGQTYMQCWKKWLVNADAPCPTSYSDSVFPKLQARNTTCPFSSEACLAPSLGYELEHHLLPVDLGLNSPSKLGIHRNLKCAPLRADYFLGVLEPPFGKYHSYLAFADVIDNVGSDDWVKYTALLETLNGRNKFSSRYSGRTDDATDDGAVDSITTLNTIPTSSKISESAHKRFIHPSLKQEEGMPFVLVYKAGATLFHTSPFQPQPLRDPIFGGTRLIRNGTTTYYPDYEATVLGCVEKLRFCRHESKDVTTDCSRWMVIDEKALWQEYSYIPPLEDFPLTSAAKNDLTRFDAIGQELAQDRALFLAYLQIVRYSSVANLVRNLEKFMVSSFRMRGREAQFIDNNQWMHEVRAFFEMALLFARDELFGQIALASRTIWVGHPKDFLECPVLLYRDSRYTNVDLIPLAITMIVVSVPVALSWYRTICTWNVGNYIVSAKRVSGRLKIRVLAFLPFASVWSSFYKRKMRRQVVAPRSSL
jgi:hypothetical protein